MAAGAAAFLFVVVVVVLAVAVVRPASGLAFATHPTAPMRGCRAGSGRGAEAATSEGNDVSVSCAHN